MKKPNLKSIGGILLISSLFGLSACKTSTRYSRSTGEYWDDKTIAHNVRRGINQDSLLKSADIKVKSFRGNVTLYGFVDHPIQKEEASAVARGTPGVQWFQNNLSVKDYMPSAQRIEPTVIQEPAGAEIGKWEKATFNRGSRPANSMNKSPSAPAHEIKPDTTEIKPAPNTEQNP